LKIRVLQWFHWLYIFGNRILSLLALSVLKFWLRKRNCWFSWSVDFNNGFFSIWNFQSFFSPLLSYCYYLIWSIRNINHFILNQLPIDFQRFLTLNVVTRPVNIDRFVKQLLKIIKILSSVLRSPRSGFCKRLRRAKVSWRFFKIMCLKLVFKSEEFRDRFLRSCRNCKLFWKRVFSKIFVDGLLTFLGSRLLLAGRTSGWGFLWSSLSLYFLLVNNDEVFRVDFYGWSLFIIFQ